MQSYQEARTIVDLRPQDLIVDIGSNDGTLLSNFSDGGHRVQGIEPSQVGNLANARNIPTIITFFTPKVAKAVRKQHGPARIVTATNVFAHMENIHAVLDGIIAMLDDKGVFISESHYLVSLVETLQYDAIYHEHLRYYSLASLKHLLDMHGLTIIHAKRIPTHGGSIRVYASKVGAYSVHETVKAILKEEERADLAVDKLQEFKKRVALSKLQLHALLLDIKGQARRIYGIGAPSRAGTLINYLGLDEGIVEYVLEVKDSYKVGKYIPGTLIPVVEESRLYEDQPEYALLFSWHIADELAPKIRHKGFKETSSCRCRLPGL